MQGVVERREAPPIGGLDPDVVLPQLVQEPAAKEVR